MLVATALAARAGVRGAARGRAAIERALDESVVLPELSRAGPTRSGASLVFSGYLKAEAPRGRRARARGLPPLDPQPRGAARSTPRVPRLDAERLGRPGSATSPGSTSALLDGDAERLEEQLQTFADEPALVPRHRDGRSRARLPRLRPRPPRRAGARVPGAIEPGVGHGRPDVTIRPRRGRQARRGAGAEGRPEGEEDARSGAPRGARADRGEGLRGRARAAGATPVHAFAVAFDGKRVWVWAAGAEKKRSRRKPRVRAKATKRR